ncbi:MAG: tRNA lysidine(34) synthetase TilS [Bacteroidales bacterium]
MQSRFDKTLGSMLRPGEKVLLAVSGGIDSMCMANLFLHSSLKFPFALAHCNFHLRAGESDSDEALVRDWATAEGVPFFKTDFDTQAYAADHSVSIEMAARDLRYAWFERIATDEGFGAVAVAHNANDNAETLILNLLRGTGGKGFCGMNATTSLPVTGSKVCLVRPLLDVPRSEIAKYVQEHRIPFHNDRTNAMTEFKRNKIRNLVFPLFSDVNPDFLNALGRDMDHAVQLEGIADSYFESAKSSVLGRSDSEVCERLNVQALRSLRHKDYFLFRALEPYGFDEGTLDALVRLLDEGPTLGGRTFLSPEYRLVTSSEELLVLRRNGVQPSRFGMNIDESEVCMTVHGIGDYCFSGKRIAVRLQPLSPGESLRMPPDRIALDSSEAGFPFLLRKWMPGDWFVPFGMKGKKKVSDLFTDLKFNVLDKDSSLVLVCPSMPGYVTGRIAAFLGYKDGSPMFRIDDCLKVTAMSETIVSLADRLFY